MSIGFTEGLIILAVVLLFFGGRKLPQVGEALGKAIRNFKKGVRELPENDDVRESEKESEEK